MTSLLGTFGLAFAFCSALAGTLSWGYAGARGVRPPLSGWLGVMPLAGVAVAVTALQTALVTHDFSVRFVAENGSRETPLYYTVTSMWAAHDGSLLLWCLVLATYLAVVALRRRGGAELHGWAVAVLSLVAAFFLGLAVFTGGVFDRVSPVPTDGPGPNPLLRDNPAMGIHPPLLYLGLVGLAVPFGYAVAGLISGRVDRTWLEPVTGYTRFAWAALTAGIVLGGWWAYAVLGWGGYWAWDPVENASLMPWLVATALLHSTMVQRRRHALPVWNLSLAVAAFLLAALGAFLTRSGLVTSVHSFADSGVGPVLLGFLVAVALGVLLLVALRTGRLGVPQPVGTALSRGAAILANNALLVALTVTVLVGTTLPMLSQAATGREIGVGEPYYDRVFVPVGLLLLVLMALGPLLSWRGDRPEAVLRTLAPPVLAAAAVVALVWLLDGRSAGAAVGLGAATLVVTTMALETAREVRAARRTAVSWPAAASRWLRSHRRRLAGRVAHLGVVLVAVGIIGSSTYTQVVERSLQRGETASLGGVTATLQGLGRERTAEQMRTSARVLVVDGDDRTVVTPSLRFFPAHQMTVAGPAVLGGLRRDVYLTVLSVDQDAERATVRFAVNPVVGLIWAGGALMILAPLLSLRTRPRTRRQPSSPPPVAAEGARP